MSINYLRTEHHEGTPLRLFFDHTVNRRARISGSPQGSVARIRPPSGCRTGPWGRAAEGGMAAEEAGAAGRGLALLLGQDRTRRLPDSRGRPRRRPVLSGAGGSASDADANAGRPVRIPSRQCLRSRRLRVRSGTATSAYPTSHVAYLNLGV